jgi:hypothetical protein
MLGQFLHTAAGTLSYEIYEANDTLVYTIVSVIEKRYGFMALLPVFSMDEIYINCHRDEVMLMVGWDEWSGCFIMAASPAGDSVVREIGQYMEDMLIDGQQPEIELR